MVSYLNCSPKAFFNQLFCVLCNVPFSHIWYVQRRSVSTLSIPRVLVLSAVEGSDRGVEWVDFKRLFILISFRSFLYIMSNSCKNLAYWTLDQYELTSPPFKFPLNFNYFLDWNLSLLFGMRLAYLRMSVENGGQKKPLDQRAGINQFLHYLDNHYRCFCFS